MASKNTEKPKNDESASQDTKANWQTSDSDTNRVLTIDVECLCGPEKQDGEEVGSRDEGDDQRQDEDARILFETSGKHGKLGEFPFPDEEGCDQAHSDE